MLFKVHHGLVQCPSVKEKLVPLPDRRRRGHDRQFHLVTSRTQYRAASFLPRTVKNCPIIPPHPLFPHPPHHLHFNSSETQSITQIYLLQTPVIGARIIRFDCGPSTLKKKKNTEPNKGRMKVGVVGYDDGINNTATTTTTTTTTHPQQDMEENTDQDKGRVEIDVVGHDDGTNDAHHLPPRWPSGKASASRAEDPGFESRLHWDFFRVESYQ